MEEELYHIDEALIENPPHSYQRFVERLSQPLSSIDTGLRNMKDTTEEQ